MDGTRTELLHPGSTNQVLLRAMNDQCEGVDGLGVQQEDHLHARHRSVLAADVKLPDGRAPWRDHSVYILHPHSCADRFHQKNTRGCSW